MLTVATTVFLYYTVWTILMVPFSHPNTHFVDTNASASNSPLWMKIILYTRSSLLEFGQSEYRSYSSLLALPSLVLSCLSS
jgi:hypothetical protein